MTRSDVLRSAGAVGLLLLIGCVQRIPDDLPAREVVLFEGRPDSILACGPDTSPPDSAYLGPGSGRVRLRSGLHQADIPSGAVEEWQWVRLQPERGNNVSVRFEGEKKIHFLEPVTLVVSIARCSSDQKKGTWHIWRRGEGNGESQRLVTGLPGNDGRRTRIDSASVFMIAN